MALSTMWACTSLLGDDFSIGDGATAGAGADPGGAGGTSNTGGTSASGGGGSSSSNGGGGSGGNATAPFVFDSAPANDATGVMEDASISVFFSEAMDRDSVEAAYQSVDLPAEDVTFAWTARGDTLTITPNDPLPYAQGTADALVTPLEFTLAITTAATDLDGTPLSAPYTLGFATARRLIISIAPTGPVSGYLDSNGYLNAANNFPAGDLTDNHHFRSFITFDITGLPSNVLVWNAATYSAEQFQQVGTPYAQLGDLHIYDSNYDPPLSFGDFSEVGADLGVFSTNATFEFKSVSVVGAVQADYPGSTSKFALKFANETNNDAGNDFVSFYDDGATLVVDVLAE